MKNTIKRGMLILSLGCSALAFTNSALAVSPEFRMVGLAMHQETGRNIYLGAVHQGADIPNPDDLSLVPAPKIMEYRIVARRTSIRSLLGSMLLQGQVANGHAPGEATAEFADQLLNSIKGSLYSGDSFELKLDADNQISATLNGIELISLDDGGTFDFLLTGWINENGPSTTFRNSIIQTDIDNSLRSVYTAHEPSEERQAAIASWSPVVAAPAVAVAIPDTREQVTEVLAPAAAEPVLAESPAAEQVAGEESLEVAVDTTIQGNATVAAGVATATVAAVETASTPSTTPKTEETEEQVASVPAGEPTPANEGTPEVEDSAALALVAENDSLTSVLADDIAALNVTEYSHRLAGFNTSVMQLVYSKIQYPRRAVRREIQGALELDITMLADGSLVKVAIAESSGYSILDGAAVEAAEKAFKSAGRLGDVDPVAIAEYANADTNNLVVPVPVKFYLQ